jgi:HD-GYP domain-containing protein (c-di-GMP phosphodiesterase class II)/DNA-binding CsgD family transcriptional regulator
VTGGTSRGTESVDMIEVAATLSLATDLSIGVPLEHGLHSAVIARRLSELADVENEEATQAFYTALLFYVGCTGTALTGLRIFGNDEALTTYAAPVRFDRPRRQVTGMARAVAPPGRPMHRRALQLARGMPRLLRAFPEVIATNCDVAQVLFPHLGLPAGVAPLFAHANDRWDGKGSPSPVHGDAIPLPMRVAQIAQDAAFQRMLGGDEFAVQVIRNRAGAAFDPEIAELFARRADEILVTGPDSSVWSVAMASETAHGLALESDAIDEALTAMGDFADLVSPYLLGHSQGVAELAAAAGRLCDLPENEQRALRRSALVHDLGRVAVPARVWATAGPLSPGDWESFRLHAYQTERLLSRSAFLRDLSVTATLHHERLDGSGYHRGCTAAALPLPARILAAADRYRTLIEPRAHRSAHPPETAAVKLAAEAREGLFDADAVAAVVEGAGLKRPRLDLPTGLSPRERTVVGLLARGLQTKQIARVLGVSPKTADTHIQHAYRKMGVSTRAGAALYASQHGLVASGELPMAPGSGRS